MGIGFDALQKHMDESKNRKNTRGLQYFNWKDGDKKILRFLTDDIITAEFYEYVMANDGKPKTFMIDEKADEDYLLKHAAGDPVIGKKRSFGDGGLEDPKRRLLTVGIAVLRDERREGRNMVVTDLIEKTEHDGKSYDSRNFGVVQQPLNMFWYQLKAYRDRYGTICDRDYEVERIGSKLDTRYSVIPCDPIDGLRTPEEVQAEYGYGAEVDENDPTRFMRCPQTLTDWATWYASEDRYKRWLSRDGAGASSAASDSPASPESPAASPAAGKDASTDFDKMRAELLEMSREVR